MHKVVQIHIEEYLDGTLLPVYRREVESHLEACPHCEEEVAEARRAREWMQLLVPEQPLAPAPGFYARLRNRVEVEKERRASWLLGFPVFTRQLGYAMMMLLVLLSGFFLTVWQTESAPTATEVIMEAPVIRAETPPLTSDRHTNREQVMQAIVAPVSMEGD